MLASDPGSAAAAPFERGFAGWRAAEGGFAGWRLEGARLTDNGAIEGSGEATGPVVLTGFAAV